MTAPDAPGARTARAALGLGDAHDRPEQVLRVSVALLVVVTLAVGTLPSFHGHVIAPALDLVLDTAAAVVCLALASLAWVRFREWRHPLSLYQAAAFLAMT